MIRLLLVEDDREYRQTTRMQLERLGGEVEIVESECAREARVKLSENRIDCIVCDYRLPDADGIELLKDVRKRGWAGPFIFLTGRGSERVAGEAIRSGADDYWVKGGGEEHFARLLHSIRRLVREREDLRKREQVERELREKFHRCHSILENAADSIFIKDRSLRYTHVNQAMERLFGLPKAELIGKTDAELFGPEAAAEIQKADKRALAGEVVELEQTKPVRNVPLTFNVIKAPLRSLDGEIIGIFGIARDLTDRVRVEEALSRSERRYRSLVEIARDVIFTLSVEGHFASSNPALERQLGWPPERWLGKGYAPLIHPGDLPLVDQAFKACLANGAVPPLECRLYRKDGDYSTMEMIATPITENDGIVGIHCVCRDIRDRKLAEDGVAQSESRYRTLFEKNIAGVFRSTLDGRLLECNEAFARMMGYDSREEIIGHSTYDLYFGCSDRDDFISELEAKGEILGQEYCLRRKDGSEIWVIENTLLLPGGILQGTLLDSTEHKRAQESLKASEARHKALLEAIPDLLIIMNTEGIILDCRVGKDSTLISRPGVLVGQNIREILPPGLVELTMQRVEKAINSGEMQTFELEVYTEGKRRALESRVVGYGNHEVMFIVRDITDRRLAQEDLERSYEKLESQTRLLDATNRELEAFAYTVSHDLQAPLRRISGWINLLLSEFATQLPQGCGDFLHKVGQNSKEMSQLVEALLNFSRVTRSEIRKVRVDLSAMAKSIAEDLRSDYPDRQVDFQVARQIVGEGDPRLLHVVMKNILSNAWKYTGKKEMPEVEFGLRQVDGATVYFVRDNGVGFDPAHAQKMFVPFQRLHTDEEFKGSGIGLATAQRIIHRHGGRIWAESKPGDGATFFFTLG